MLYERNASAQLATENTSAFVLPASRSTRVEALSNDTQLFTDVSNRRGKDIKVTRRGEKVIESLDQSYSIPNDVSFLEKMSSFSEEKKRYYVYQNLITTCIEFADKSPVKELVGIFKPQQGEIEICGMDIRKMYKDTTKQAGSYSREAYEEQGLDTIFEMLKNHDKAYWVSAPKIADYAFCMEFEKGAYDSALGGYPLREKLWRYDEKLGNLARSKEVYKGLEKATGQSTSVAHLFLSYRDFLQAPIAVNTAQLKDKDFLPKLLGIEKAGIDHSLEYEKRLIIQTHKWMDAYFNAVYELANAGISEEKKKNLLEAAKDYRDAIFFAAQDLSEQLKHEEKTGIKTAALNLVNDKDMLRYQAQRMNQGREATVMGGSNCNVTPHASSLHRDVVAELLERGNTLEQIIHTGGETSEHFGVYKCPSCKKNIAGERKDGRNWKTECPHCRSKAISCKKKAND